MIVTAHYKDEGFVELKVEIDEEDLREIVEEYLTRHHAFDFDEMELVNNRPMNIWLHAKCRKFLDPENPDEEALDEAEVTLKGPYENH